MSRLSCVLLALLALVGCKTDPEDTGLLDADGDGYTVGEDCDDGDPAVHPDQAELCATPVDDDCDGRINEGTATDATEWFPDGDGDGFGAFTTGVFACEQPAGTADNVGDCEDADSAVNPAAVEVCDGVDNDCEGTVDGPDAADAWTWYTDADGDGFGDPNEATRSCEISLSGHVADAQDCDDNDPDVHPDADEVCDGVDNDCEGTVDGPEALDALTFYRDGDGDGFGLSTETLEACTPPSGYAETDRDCDDTRAGINPGADELCDGVDNDCDGFPDEDDALDAGDWYLDGDGDGDGDPATWTVQCAQPAGYVSSGADCDDADPTLNSGTLWYYDEDLDGYGVSSSTLTQCAEPGSAYVRVAGDCLPTDDEGYPGADEYCDGVDNDCDGDTDEDDAVDAATWYADADSDSWGDAASTAEACTAPSGYVADSSDCDDSDASVEGPSTWYADLDSDGEGDTGSSASSCTQPSGYVLDGSDCDDGDATLNSATSWYYDGDLDGFGAGSVAYTQCSDPGASYVRTDTDCEASDASSYPGAPEICLSGTAAEGVDNDCDGDVDEDCAAVHCGTLSVDETWSASEDHVVTCDVYVQGSGGPVLTIDAGAQVAFDTGTALWVGYAADGDIAVNGTSTDPVVFTSAQSSPAAGDWGGLYLFSGASSSVVDDLSVSYGGQSSTYVSAVYANGMDLEVDGLGVYDSGGYGVYLRNGSLLMANSEVQDSLYDGVYLGLSGTLDTTTPFASNTLSGNGGHPITLTAEDVHMLDTSSSFSGNVKDSIRVSGGAITQDTTWALHDVDYTASSVFVGAAGAVPVWTVEDGVRVEMAASSIVLVGVGDTGEVDIQGTSAGVVFTSAQSSPAPGDWHGMVLGSGDADSQLQGLEVAYAGSGSYPGGLSVASDAVISDCSVHDSSGHGIYVFGSAAPSITDTSIEDNGDYGLLVLHTAALGASFSNNTLSGNLGSPVYLPANYVGLLESSSSYSGNGDDRVEVGRDTVDSDATWQALGVPFHLLGTVWVQGTGSPVLEIEDGVTLEVDASNGIRVGFAKAGALALQGDTVSGSGITLTSAESSPAMGDWGGIYLGSYTTEADTVLEGFTLEYAGYDLYSRAGLYVNGVDVALSDCLITLNNGDGIRATGASLGVQDCEISDNQDDGIALGTSGGLSGSFADNVLTGNGGYPIELPANGLGLLETSSSFSGNTLDQIHVLSDVVEDDATWSAHDVDYYVSGSVYIESSGGVNVETDGATFYMDSGVGLWVGNAQTGALQANNAVFTSAQSVPSAGDWPGIRFGYYATDADCEITNSTVSYGGANGYGNVYLYYTDATITGNVLSHSGSYGIYGLGLGSPTVSGNSYSGNASGDSYGI